METHIVASEVQLGHVRAESEDAIARAEDAEHQVQKLSQVRGWRLQVSRSPRFHLQPTTRCSCSMSSAVQPKLSMQTIPPPSRLCRRPHRFVLAIFHAVVAKATVYTTNSVVMSRHRAVSRWRSGCAMS